MDEDDDDEVCIVREVFGRGCAKFYDGGVQLCLGGVGIVLDDSLNRIWTTCLVQSYIR